MTRLHLPLPDGPLDLIGDVHGELEALLALLHRLGCDPDRATASRPLVFVGDLIDRGPDSFGVVEVVRRLADRGLAYCALGNHELNLLLGAEKEGNGWFLGHEDAWEAKHDGAVIHRPFASLPVPDAEREALLAWFRTLPLTFSRPDLRVVHACWDDAAIAALPDAGDVAALYRAYEVEIDDRHRQSGLIDASAAEVASVGGLFRLEPKITTLLPHTAALTESRQNDHPIRVLTSGREKTLVAPDLPFHVGGKWRMVRRDPWWLRYTDAPAVVVGHYWRVRGAPIRGKVDSFLAESPYHWAGGGGGVFCVDYSVGRRFQERVFTGEAPFRGGLGALRWPEQQVVFDDEPAPVPTQRR